jgi:hypothetical protein
MRKLKLNKVNSKYYVWKSNLVCCFKEHPHSKSYAVTIKVVVNIRNNVAMKGKTVFYLEVDNGN